MKAACSSGCGTVLQGVSCLSVVALGYLLHKPGCMCAKCGATSGRLSLASRQKLAKEGKLFTVEDEDEEDELFAPFRRQRLQQVRTACWGLQ